jgi:hypothetical protein
MLMLLTGDLRHARKLLEDFSEDWTKLIRS